MGRRSAAARALIIGRERGRARAEDSPRRWPPFPGDRLRADAHRLATRPRRRLAPRRRAHRDRRGRPGRGRQPGPGRGRPAGGLRASRRCASRRAWRPSMPSCATHRGSWRPSPASPEPPSSTSTRATRRRSCRTSTTGTGWCSRSAASRRPQPRTSGPCRMTPTRTRSVARWLGASRRRARRSRRSGPWPTCGAGVARGALPASEIAKRLADHDLATFAATQDGTAGRYADALKGLGKARAELTAALEIRDQLVESVDTTTLDIWVDRNRTYDDALAAPLPGAPRHREDGSPMPLARPSPTSSVRRSSCRPTRAPSS